MRNCGQGFDGRLHPRLPAEVDLGVDAHVGSANAATSMAVPVRGHAVRAARERTTLRIIAVSFLALAAYVAVDAIRALTGTGEAECSIPGIVISALSISVLTFLSAAERRAVR